MKKTLIALILFLGFLECISQSDYCKLIDKKKPINFYWDWHKYYEYKVPMKIYKETTYHHDIRTGDSALERETYYNGKGQPIVEKQYAVPSKEGIIAVDSFFYDQRGLPLMISRRYLSCAIGFVTVTELFEFDSLGRQILKTVDGPSAGYTETNFDSLGKIISRKYFPNGILATEEVHFYNRDNQEDSMQVFRFGEWIYTTEFLYDSVERTKESYFRTKKRKVFRSLSGFNADGTVNSLLIKGLPNWNHTKLLEVESKLAYNEDHSIKECAFFIKGKKIFYKRHYYEYY